MHEAQESLRAAQNIQEETNTDRGETESERAEEGENGVDTPPSPIPRICWQ